MTVLCILLDMDYNGSYDATAKNIVSISSNRVKYLYVELVIMVTPLLGQHL